MKKLSELTEKLVINSKSKIINNTTCDISELADEIIDVLDIDQTHDTVVDSIKAVLQWHRSRYRSNDFIFKYVDESNCQDYNLQDKDIEWLKVRPSHLISGRAIIASNNYIYKDFNNHKIAFWYFYDTRDGIDNTFIIIVNGENVKIFFIEA